MNHYFAQLVYAVFAIGLLLYWKLLPQKKIFQNLIILAISYTCYLLLGWNLLALLLLVSASGYFAGNFIHKAKTRRQAQFILILNTSLLLILFFIFKYSGVLGTITNENQQDVMTGVHLNTFFLFVPLGISIYMLQVLSYTFDIYLKKIQFDRNPLPYLISVSFFPQLFAGPIELARKIYPQYNSTRVYNAARFETGISQVVWGMFKIVVIANHCNLYASEVFNNYEDYNGVSILAGILCFSLQFYADLSGLSDIARGTARMFGIELSENFRFPFTAKTMVEFWNRWNISLITFVETYMIGKSQNDQHKMIKIAFNQFILYSLVGFWHGGIDHILVFGFINMCLVLPFLFSKKNLSQINVKYFRFSIQTLGVVFTLALVIIGMTFFRADSSDKALQILTKLIENPFTISVNQLRALGNGFTSTLISLMIISGYILFEIWNSIFGLKYVDFNHTNRLKGYSLRFIIIIILLILFLSRPGPENPYFIF